MTIDPSYTENELRRVGAEYNLSGYLDRVIRRSTPDTRLPAIADAWNYDDELKWMDSPNSMRQDLRAHWPELAALLDALTEEDNDGHCVV